MDPRFVAPPFAPQQKRFAGNRKVENYFSFIRRV